MHDLLVGVFGNAIYTTLEIKTDRDLFYSFLKLFLLRFFFGFFLSVSFETEYKIVSYDSPSLGSVNANIRIFVTDEIHEQNGTT